MISRDLILFCSAPLLLLLTSCAQFMSSTTVTPCFTPQGGCSDSIAAEITKAKTEVLIQTSSLTSKTVADAIVKAKSKGLNVEIILDRSVAQTQSCASYFSSIKNVPTFIDTKHLVARNNAVIIDSETVIAGSYSYTYESEDRNAENLVVIRSRSVAANYRDNWNSHRSHASEFKQPGEPKECEPVRKKPKKLLKKKTKTS